MKSVSFDLRFPFQTLDQSFPVLETGPPFSVRNWLLVNLAVCARIPTQQNAPRNQKTEPENQIRKQGDNDSDANGCMQQYFFRRVHLNIGVIPISGAFEPAALWHTRTTLASMKRNINQAHVKAKGRQAHAGCCRSSSCGAGLPTVSTTVRSYLLSLFR